jgi:hypothetical protein
MSESRFGFPMFPLPGIEIEEMEHTITTVSDWNNLVEMCILCSGYTESRMDAEHEYVVLEGLSSLVLSTHGCISGYDTEEYDDTSSPYQKWGSNCDCEDFAISVCALVTRIINDPEFLTIGSSSMGRKILTFIRDTYEWGRMCTGYATPHTAVPNKK